MKITNVDDEYKKFSDLKKDEILKIIDWIHSQSHLPQDITEREVILFHFSCHFSVEMTKITIDQYYTFRTHCPDLFSNLDVFNENIKRTMDTISMLPIKNKSTSEGYKVIITRLHNFDPGNFIYADCIKLYNMVIDLWLLQDGIQAGHILVVDTYGCTLGHVARLNPLIMKKFLTYLQEAMPIRLKGLHFVNCVPFMDKILAIMKPFMKQELLNMLHIHTNIDDFYKFVSKDVLPQEHGGTNGNVEELREKIYKDVIENRQYFLDEEKTRRVNEKLRPGKPKNATDLFGAEGNFKKLDFD